MTLKATTVIVPFTPDLYNRDVWWSSTSLHMN